MKIFIRMYFSIISYNFYHRIKAIDWNFYWNLRLIKFFPYKDYMFVNRTDFLPKLTLRLSGRIPCQGHSQSATNPPPYSITRLFVPRTSFLLFLFFSFFFLQPEKCKPLRIPRVYISKTKQQVEAQQRTANEIAFVFQVHNE